MRKVKFSFLLILFAVVVLESCAQGRREMSEEEAVIADQLRTKYSAGGKHGFFPVLFIVGRIKKTPIADGLPVNINVLDADAELLGKPIAFKILDTLNYQITYQKNETETAIVKGVFGKNSGDEKIGINVTKNVSNETIEKITMIDYEFKIHAY